MRHAPFHAMTRKGATWVINTTLFGYRNKHGAF